MNNDNEQNNNNDDNPDNEEKIGVYLCHCGGNISDHVDVDKVAENVKGLPGVVKVQTNSFMCSDPGQGLVKQDIQEHGLNRIVIASCSPRTHEPLFRETMREAGLNPYLFEMTNIRDQCSWVHSNEPEAATEKSIELAKMAIARSRNLSPLQGSTLAVNQSGLVIGGGLTGMTAALSLAEQGFKVNLIHLGLILG